MEKHHKTIAAVGEFDLPEEIIHQIMQHILMSEGEAARTALVSKSWYGAWSTRPNLSFVQHELQNSLQQFATKTLQRYEDLNLNIQTFRLRMYEDDSLARELILKAIKLGAIDLMIHVTTPAFVLPDEVLESQTLVRLSVYDVEVDLDRMINKPLTSSNLKSLTLSNTVTKGDLSRRFPLLEELTVEGVFSSCLPISGCTTTLQKLKFLQLKHLNTENCFSKSELWLQFPCLKTLVIRNCHFKGKGNGEDVIRICSPSLECITISLRGSKAKLEFDVPNIRKFKFEGYDVPRLELKTSSREWESDIRITCSAYMGSVLCLRSLKQFVKQLSPSRVSLALYLGVPQLGMRDGFVGDGSAIPGEEDGFVGDGLAIPALENLTIRGFGVLSPAFLNALFWSCRPNFVNIQRRCVFDIEKENVKQFQYLSSLPWNTLLDVSWDDWEEFVCFQLK